VTENPLFFLLPTPQSDLATEFDLPDNDDNLFQRIIRNPHIEASNPRERECTEMLCAVLRNTTVLRSVLLRWMADLIGVQIDCFDELQFTIETEGAIGSKRDDLRIEGWLESDDDRTLVLLWTVEVKVGASFHESTPLDGVAIPDEDESLVNQVINYDHWLENQVVPYRAGFVLALTDTSNLLPPKLHCRWECMSWTQLGLEIQTALGTENLPEKEKFLARHLLGFISNHLWRVSEMTEIELNFDDVALLRAFTAIGRDTEVKIDRMVESLVSVIQESGIGYGKATHSKTLFKPMQRSVVWRYVFEPDECQYPALWAGVTGAHLTIWFEAAMGYNKRSVIDSLVQSLLPSLNERNNGWSVGDLSYQVLGLSKPLVSLLDAEDQTSEFQKFFEAALEDIRAVGFIEMLKERLAL
jgi:hypothetical protein